MQYWVFAFRTHQWSKNLLIFVPLFLSHFYTNHDKIVLSCVAFAIMCTLVSGTYIFNDIIDLKFDKLHASKRHRPFASGRLNVKAGYLFASLFIGIALAVSNFISLLFLLILFSYLILTLIYTLIFRRQVLLDVFLIAILFTLRVDLGIVAIDAPQSPWLLSFSFCFFLSLAFAKRHAELIRATGRRALISGRGYFASDWPLTISFGVSSGMISIVIMLLYLTNDAAPSGFYPNLYWLYAVPAVVTIWVMQIWTLAQRGKLRDDPVIFALKDWRSWLLGIVAFFAFLMAAHD